MATNEIRISFEDFQRDGSPEIVLEFYTGKKLDFSTSVSSAEKNGTYDTVDVKGDADNDGDFDPTDDELFIKLGQAAARLLK